MTAKTIKTVALWIFRLTGFAALCFFLTFFVGEGIPDILSEGFVMDAAFAVLLVYLVLSAGGFVLSFFLRRTGGLLMLAAAVLMGGMLAFRGDFAVALIYALPFAISGGTAVFVSK